MTDTYRIRSAETWDRARDDYLAGDTAERVCARYDLGTSNFHRRANAEGWRRADQVDPGPLDLEDDDPDDLPAADLPVIADLAQRRMAQAVRRGRVVEALRWQKLHQTLATQIAAQAETERKADATQAHTPKAPYTRPRVVLPPNATPLQRVEAQLRAMVDGNDSLFDDLERLEQRLKLEEMENLEDLESVSSADPDDPVRYWPSTHLSKVLAEAKAATSGLNRAQRRRIEKRSRKQE